MLQVKNLVKRYTTKGETVTALDHVSVDFPEKGMVFLLGKSGSGKSTLLNLSGGLDSPDEGEIVVKGRSSKNFSKSDFDSYRNTYVGFVFQEYNILYELTVAENVALAIELQGKPKDRATVEKLLELVDLKGYGDRRPNTLSGGQKQRVAIARALVKDPEIIMADEPTGALDSATGAQVFDTLKKLSAEKLVVVVSHDREFAEQYADRIIELKDGKIVSDMSRGEGSITRNLIEGDGELTVACGAALTDEEAQKVVSFLRERKGSVLIAAQEQPLAAESRAVFHETVPVPQPQETECGTFIRSKFPMRYALKMGVSGLKFKPLRLAFTTLLATIAFIVFGVFSTLITYDSLKINANTLETSSFSAGVLRKKGIVHSVNQDGPFTRNFPVNLTQYLHFDGRDIAVIEAEHPEMDFVPVFDFGLSPLSTTMSQTNVGDGDLYTADNYYGQMRFFNSFAFVSDVQEKTDFEVVAGRLPQDTVNSICEVAISQTMFETFCFYGYRENSGARPIEINSFEDLDGKTITAVTGATTVYMTVVGVIDTREDFSDYEYLKTAEQATDAETSELYEHYRYSFASLGFVSDGFYDAHQSIDLAPTTYRSAMDDLRRGWGNSNTTAYAEHPEEGILYAFLYSTLRKDRQSRSYTTMSYHRRIDEARDVFYATPYSFANDILAGEETLSAVLPVIGPVAGGLAVFAALLLFNFISASINAKKKDIGILRAVGARGIDVFKIFMVEGIAIALVSYVLGCLGCLAACAVANAILIRKEIMTFSFFLFDWLNALMVLGVSLVTAIFSTAVPVALSVRKRPVEVIRAI